MAQLAAGLKRVSSFKRNGQRRDSASEGDRPVSGGGGIVQKLVRSNSFTRRGEVPWP